MQILNEHKQFQIWGYLPDADTHKVIERWHGPGTEGRWEVHLVSGTHPPMHPCYGVLLLEHPDMEIHETYSPILVQQIACFRKNVFKDADQRAKASFDDLVETLQEKYGKAHDNSSLQG